MVTRDIDHGAIDERLDRLEVAHNQTQRTLARVVALMDGDPSYRITGIPDQLAAYIKANEDWKRATEARITENDSRLRTLEGKKQIMITPAAALLLVIIGATCLVAAYYAITWMQSAG